jgi:streptogramin lyase
MLPGMAKAPDALDRPNSMPSSPAAVGVTLAYKLPGNKIPESLRYSKYVGASNTQISITITPLGGVPTTYGPTACTPASCTVNFSTAPGITTLAFVLSDGVNTLSKFSTTRFISPSTMNTLSFTANPVVDSVNLQLAGASVNAGSSTDVLLNVNALDKDGNIIAGAAPYVDANGNAVSLELKVTNVQAGGQGSVALHGPTLISAPNQAAIYAHYDGRWLDHADISVNAESGAIPGGLTGTTITTIPLSIEYSGLSSGFAPFEIVSARDGNLWFTSDSFPKIGKITPDGAITEFTAGITAGAVLYGITAGADGNIWFAEINKSTIGRITPTGNVTEFNTGIIKALDIANGPDGSLWFTEGSADSIGRISPNGVVSQFNSGITPGSTPDGITVGPNGNIWFTEANAKRVAQLKPNKQAVEYAYTDGGTIQSTSSLYNFSLATGSDGNIWFASASLDSIGRCTPNGITTTFAVPGGRLSHFALGPDGNMWFSDWGNDAIGSITPSGVITEYRNGIGVGAPTGIAFGPDGNMWFTDFSNNAIGKFVL